MDIRNYFIGGSSQPAQNSVNNSLSSKRPPEKVKPNTKKSLKRNSKYFKQPTEGLSGSETEEIPSSPEPEEKTVKKPEISDTSKNNKPSIIQNKVQSPSSIKILSKSSKTKKPASKAEESKKPSKKEEFESGPLTGKTFVITGLLKDYNRDALTDLIKEYGGKVTGSVSKRTTYLVHGHVLEDGRDFTLGKKYTKALEIGTRILDEDAIKAILDECMAKKMEKVEKEIEILRTEEKENLGKNASLVSFKNYEGIESISEL